MGSGHAVIMVLLMTMMLMMMVVMMVVMMTMERQMMDGHTYTDDGTFSM